MDELGVDRPKQPLAHASKPRFRARSRLLGDPVPCQKGLEIDAAEVGTAVHYDGIGQSPPPTHTDAQGHHARAVAWLIECKPHRQDAPRVRIHQEAEPGLAEILACTRAAALDFELGMVQVGDVPGAVAVPGCVEAQVPVERLAVVGGTAATAGTIEIVRLKRLQRLEPRLVPGCLQALTGARVGEHPINDLLAWRVRLAELGDGEFRHEVVDSLWEPRRTIAGVWLGNEADIAPPVLLFRSSICRGPAFDGAVRDTREALTRQIGRGNLAAEVGNLQVSRARLGEDLPHLFGQPAAILGRAGAPK